jgi:hypothetical protein
MFPPGSVKLAADPPWPIHRAVQQLHSAGFQLRTRRIDISMGMVNMNRDPASGPATTPGSMSSRACRDLEQIDLRVLKP